MTETVTTDAQAPAKGPSYNKLEDRQLGWIGFLSQWLVIEASALYFALFTDYQVKGREHKPQGFQSYIVASNHVSMLDPLVVAVAFNFQPISYMAKIELYKHPLAVFFFKNVASFAVNREKIEVSTIKSALKVMRHGKWALGIFPEGTRNKDGEGVKETKKGVAYFSKSGNVPVLPVGFVIRPGKRKQIRVCIGPPIPPEEDTDVLSEKITVAMAQLMLDAQAMLPPEPVTK